MNANNDMQPIAAAAKATGYTQQALRKAVKSGRLKGSNGPRGLLLVSVQEVSRSMGAPSGDLELAAATGLVVRETREERGLTIDSLAERANVHRNTLMHIEHGIAGATFTRVVRLVDALDISFAEFGARLDEARKLLRT